MSGLPSEPGWPDSGGGVTIAAETWLGASPVVASAGRRLPRSDQSSPSTPSHEAGCTGAAGSGDWPSSVGRVAGVGAGVGVSRVGRGAGWTVAEGVVGTAVGGVVFAAGRCGVIAVVRCETCTVGRGAGGATGGWAGWICVPVGTVTAKAGGGPLMTSGSLGRGAGGAGGRAG